MVSLCSSLIYEIRTKKFPEIHATGSARIATRRRFPNRTNNQWYAFRRFMANNHERERWLEDIDARQRNVVFPDTVQNEGRLWRNLSNPAFNAAAKAGLALIGLFVYGNIAFFLAILIREDKAWKQELAATVLLLLLIFGPIFGVIIWATRRSFRKGRQHASNQGRKVKKG